MEKKLLIFPSVYHFLLDSTSTSMLDVNKMTKANSSHTKVMRRHLKLRVFMQHSGRNKRKLNYFQVITWSWLWAHQTLCSIGSISFYFKHGLCMKLCFKLYWMTWELFQKVFSIPILWCWKFNVNLPVYVNGVPYVCRGLVGIMFHMCLCITHEKERERAPALHAGRHKK